MELVLGHNLEHSSSKKGMWCRVLCSSPGTAWREREAKNALPSKEVKSSTRRYLVVLLYCCSRLPCFPGKKRLRFWRRWQDRPRFLALWAGLVWLHSVQEQAFVLGLSWLLWCRIRGVVVVFMYDKAMCIPPCVFCWSYGYDHA